MKEKWLSVCIGAALVPVVAASTSPCQGGLFLLDFAVAVGEAEGWDTIDPIMAEEECVYQGAPTPCTVFRLTDRAGADDNVTLEILEVPFIGNTAPYLSEPQLYDDVDVPLEALGDYQYRNPDTAGTSAPFRFDNLDPGQYRVTVFEGRTTDGNGQFAKVWAGDADGSNEPGIPGEHTGQNTGDFAADSASVELTLGEGQYLWYRHLEDNSGGISGMIIRQLSGIDDVPGDFNADGIVDSVDYQIMLTNFNADGSFGEGDMDYSGHVDMADFLEFREVYSSQASPAAAVPEPAAGLSALIAFGALCRAARRRGRLLADDRPR
jgi:hypothetical protein